MPAFPEQMVLGLWTVRTCAELRPGHWTPREGGLEGCSPPRPTSSAQLCPHQGLLKHVICQLLRAWDVRHVRPTRTRTRTSSVDDPDPHFRGDG